MNSRSTLHSTQHSSPSSKSCLPPDISAMTHPSVLACKCQDSSYGVSFIPWDERIRLQTPPPNMNSFPHVIGTISLTDCVVPVFDLRPESSLMGGDHKATAYLLTVSMLSKATGPMAVGLLVEAVNGKVNIPPDAILNLARSN